MSMVFLGGGNMAEAIIKGLVESGTVAAQDIQVVDIVPERLGALAAAYGVGTCSTADEVLGKADTLFLAVKPQGLLALLDDISSTLPVTCLVVSIAAGIRCVSIEEKLAAGTRVVRVMPNTPALVGKGAAAVAAGQAATQEDLDVVTSWMNAVGVAVQVEEPAMDAVTALSGSGPAYGFYLLEGMLEAAAQLGMEEGQARMLAAATLEGAARMVLEGSDAPGTLRERVTSKGGTTAAALGILEDAGVKATIVKALLAAHERSKELSDGT